MPKAPISLRRAAAVVLAAAALVLGAVGPGIAQGTPGLGPAPRLAAAPPPAPTVAGIIRDIRVEGTERIDPSTVRSYLKVQPGDPFDPERIDASLKALFATGYFSDVKLTPAGDTLVVHVVENPIINRIAYEGNHHIDDKALNQEVQLKPRQVYTRTRVQSDVARILELYRRKGRFAARVDPKIIQLAQNRVDLVFEIDEGPETHIERIVFIGNHRFSDGALREEISSHESRWYRFFASDDIYDPDRVSFDREKLRRFYLKNGYADFRVISAIAELNQAKTGFILTFTIEEGERYKLGKIDVASQLKDLPVDQVKSLIDLKTGDWYDAEAVEKIIDKITDKVGTLGYAFVDVRPRIHRNREEHTIDITFEIGEGPKVYVDRIEIEGNVRTLDRVIRREFKLVEGDAFNTQKLRRSKQRLENLGFFEKVDVQNVPSDQPDRTTVKVKVKEQATGELSLGAGYSTSAGPLGDISVRERNFLGKGQDVRLGFQLSFIQQQIQFGFTEPYFMDRPIAAGFDLFDIRTDNSNYSSYNINTMGVTLRAKYNITEALTQGWRYTLRRDDISPNDFASVFVQAERGVRVTSMIGQDLTYDKRDNRFDPTSGYMLSLGTDVAGAGGDTRFARVTGSASYYYPIAEDWTAAAVAQAGGIWGLGQDVRLNDRFYLGGESFPGFAVRGIGPRDSTTSDALGGNYYYTGKLELTFPLGLPKEYGFKGKLFGIAGSLFDIDDNSPLIVQSDAIRASAGVGVAWRSPFGPLRVDFSLPILRESFDKTEHVLFSFGTRF